MEISAYQFGTLTVKGRTFSSDLIIFPDGRIQDNWFRTSGHLLIPDDIETLILADPEIIIAGTGAYGRMAIAGDLPPRLAQKGIELAAMETGKAVDRFNRMINDKAARIGACFHLTC